MFTVSMKRIALLFTLCAVAFAGGIALSADGDTNKSSTPNDPPWRTNAQRYGEVDSSQLLDELDKDSPPAISAKGASAYGDIENVALVNKTAVADKIAKVDKAVKDQGIKQVNNAVK